jgi:hypothetical protein
LSNFRKVVISFVHYSLNLKLTKKLSKKWICLLRQCDNLVRQADQSGRES